MYTCSRPVCHCIRYNSYKLVMLKTSNVNNFNWVGENNIQFYDQLNEKAALV